MIDLIDNKISKLQDEIAIQSFLGDYQKCAYMQAQIDVLFELREEWKLL